MKLIRLYAMTFFVTILMAACSRLSVQLDPAAEWPPENEAEPITAIEPRLLELERAGPTETTIGQGDGILENNDQGLWPDGETRLDQQGFVEVAVTPLNLNALNDSLNFNVGLNTHSVDLSMDLAPLATLEADNGRGVQALLWDAPRGGHHVSGVLSFPVAVDGARLLEDASHLTLTIRDVDAPKRSFTWSLAG